MDEEEGRRGNGAVLTVILVVVGVLVLMGIVQGFTSGRVGVGALSIQFGQSESTNTPTLATADPSAPQAGAAAPEQLVSGVDSAPRTLSGSWKLQRGMITIEITRVDFSGGLVRMTTSVTNASPGRMDLPLASIIAIDSAQRTHGAAAQSNWPGSVAAGATFSGIIELVDKVDSSAGPLTVAFTQITGQFAPPKGATIPDVPLPM
ncbi:MAG TPA: hypothetical protein VGP03_12350 [Pseudonocardiaceae bacterium]|jgi:hypothetical protein|nr:hypothetical protein [Pseudonocardiaceae bacterium]